MLQLILGRSGSGKTHRIYDELTTSVVKGGAGGAHSAGAGAVFL